MFHVKQWSTLLTHPSREEIAGNRNGIAQNRAPARIRPGVPGGPARRIAAPARQLREILEGNPMWPDETYRVYVLEENGPVRNHPVPEGRQRFLILARPAKPPPARPPGRPALDGVRDARIVFAGLARRPARLEDRRGVWNPATGRRTA